MLTIIKDKKYTLGWPIVCRFVISLHKKDLTRLNGLILFFLGIVSFMGENAVQYRVESLKDLAIIMNHFDKYPLRFFLLINKKNIKSKRIIQYLNKLIL